MNASFSRQYPKLGGKLSLHRCGTCGDPSSQKRKTAEPFAALQGPGEGEILNLQDEFFISKIFTHRTAVCS